MQPTILLTLLLGTATLAQPADLAARGLDDLHIAIPTAIPSLINGLLHPSPTTVAGGGGATPTASPSSLLSNVEGLLSSPIVSKVESLLGSHVDADLLGQLADSLKSGGLDFVEKIVGGELPLDKIEGVVKDVEEAIQMIKPMLEGLGKRAYVPVTPSGGEA